MSNLTLAITTVGDLLLNGKLTRREDGHSEPVRLTIPVYQRPYKWSARNAIQLLDDIIEARNANKEVYRVGTLILHKDGCGNYNIVDGQQRTITFSLLLYALYELEQEQDRLKIEFLEQDVLSNQFSRRNIPNNLNAFRRRILKGATDEADGAEHKRNMQNLRSFIESQCELIVVVTENLSEAFQFFDSQNARGKALYPHDLLKAYHLREMTDLKPDEVEQIVAQWETIPQDKLAEFFGQYIYRIKEWINGNWAESLTEHNIYKFKGINRTARTPYAQFYKSAYSYAQMINNSAMPFVSGTREINAFQLNTPIIAGKPFFDYTQHYYRILHDVHDNSKYEGFYIKDNEIVKTLDRYFDGGSGNRIVRLLFDTALLLYVDRFCPATFPTKEDTELFERFVVYAFIWAYSLRAQYYRLGWQSTQNYILGGSGRVNEGNIYKLITDSDTPLSLLSAMEDLLSPISVGEDVGNIDCKDDGVYRHYLHFFAKYNFLDK